MEKQGPAARKGSRMAQGDTPEERSPASDPGGHGRSPGDDAGRGRIHLHTMNPAVADVRNRGQPSQGVGAAPRGEPDGDEQNSAAVTVAPQPWRSESEAGPCVGAVLSPKSAVMAARTT